MLRGEIACAVLFALACGRDLQPLPLRTAPSLASIDPPSAFAGEPVVLHGGNLGDPSDVRVFFGASPATVQQQAQPDGSLIAVVPAGLDKAPQDVSIANSQGRSVLAASFSYLGLGHPAALTIRGQAHLSPKIVYAAVLGTTGFLFDFTHHLLIRIDPESGVLLNLRQLRVPASASILFGQPESPWLFSNGEIGQPPNLHRYDYTKLPPAEACPAPPPPLGIPLPAATDAFETGNASASADGTLLALPSGDAKVPSVLLVHLSSCTPTFETVPLPGASGYVRSATAVAGGEVIAFTEDQIFRIAAGSNPAVVLGDTLPGSQLFDLSILPALDPSSNRIAYLDESSNIDFVTWGASGTPPHLSTDQIVTIGRPTAFAFNNDGSRFFEGRFIVIAHDTATFQPVGSAELTDDALSMAALPNGGMLVASTLGFAVVAPGGFLLEDSRISPGITGIAVGTADKPFFAGELDSETFIPEGFHGIPSLARYSNSFDGVSGGEGGGVSWSLSQIYLRDEVATEWVAGPAVAIGRQIVWAARSKDGFIAAYSTTDTDSELDLFAPGETVSATRVDAAGSGGIVVFAEGVLYAATGQAGALKLWRFKSGTLTPQGDPLSLDRADGATQKFGFIQALWPSRGLGGVVAAVGVSPSQTIVRSFLTLWSKSGTRADLELPLVFVNSLALSADGRALFAGTQTFQLTAAIDAGLLSLSSSGALQIVPTLHQVLPGDPRFAASSLEGDRLYVTFTDQAAQLE